MQKNIIWKGIAYHSIENCILTHSDSGSQINATIIGIHDNAPYKISYRIGTNKFWEIKYLELNTQLHNSVETIVLEEFRGCTDVDISLTPFTNTLPINRLRLAEKEEKQIKVLYVDVLDRKVMPVLQKYTRLTQTDYTFENVPNDFEAVITVDQWGLVVHYPGLFERTFITESHYPDILTSI